MPFEKADLNREKEDLLRLVNKNEDVRKVFEDFQTQIAIKEHQLIQMQKAENLPQNDVENVMAAFDQFRG